ncbi:MAG: SRPBCC family protein [Acidimicrobiales bacterium]|nr:SRPBCC family protein [Acidimicrobiales bacterium]
MSDNTTPLRSHSDSIRIAAPPSKVWELVTAMERYGEWSSENTGGYWRKGEDGQPGTGRVGDQFVGINKRGDQEWKAPVEIVEREEGRSYAFVTGGLAANFALWRYELQPDGDGTLLTESWSLNKKTPNMDTGGEAAIEERVGYAKESIAATLAGMKKAAES